MQAFAEGVEGVLAVGVTVGLVQINGVQQLWVSVCVEALLLGGVRNSH
jgi:hypothetical protein